MSVFFMISACNQGHHHDSESDTTSASHGDTTLTLNNGERWVVDSLTKDNFDNLETSVDMFYVDPFPPIDSYQAFGNDVSQALNTMISQCKMKGEAHEVLHRWMNPLISQSNELKNIQDTLLARKLADSIHVRVGRFTNYFKATP